MPHPEERRCPRTRVQTKQRIGGRYETLFSLSGKRGPDPGDKSPAHPACSAHFLTASSVAPYLGTIQKLIAFDLLLLWCWPYCLQFTAVVLYKIVIRMWLNAPYLEVSIDIVSEI